MIKIAICDDEVFYTKQLTEALKTYEQTYNEQFDIKIFHDGYKLIKLVANDSNCFDLIFLDNLMPQINGIDVAKSIRLTNSDVPLIFVTSTKEFAFDSYQVKASSYLLKPVSQAQLSTLLNDIVIQIRTTEERTITINTQKESIKLKLSTIYFFESHLRKVIVHTQHEELEFYEKLSNLEEKLHQDQFIRCHQSYLLNASHIKAIKNNHVLLSNHTELPISKKYQQTVKSHFTNYLNSQFD